MNPPNNPPNILPNPPKWTYDLVEERLVEAWTMLMRLPDREAGWLASGTMSLWRMVSRDLTDASADETPIVRTALSSRDVDRMNETLGWLDHVSERDRKLVGLVLRELARGVTRVSWRSLLCHFGLRRGTDGLRKRYSRSITKICNALNAADFRAPHVSSRFNCDDANNGCPLDPPFVACS